MRAFLVLDVGPIEPEMLFAFDLQCPGIRSQVDRVTSAALLFAADRAIAKLVGHGRVAFHREMDGAATARPFERERHVVSFRQHFG